MSTKTIAVDARVYDKLASVKREGESFSKAIERLIDEVGAACTGRDILRLLAELPPLPEEDAEVMLSVVADNRRSETWDEHDLR
jgi:predicted CopG family antitoxin